MTCILTMVHVRAKLKHGSFPAIDTLSGKVPFFGVVFVFPANRCFFFFFGTLEVSKESQQDTIHWASHMLRDPNRCGDLKDLPILKTLLRGLCHRRHRRDREAELSLQKGYQNKTPLEVRCTLDRFGLLHCIILRLVVWVNPSPVRGSGRFDLTTNPCSLHRAP